MNKKCKNCHKIFYVFPSRVNRINCCSVKCSGLVRRISICPQGHDKNITGRYKNGACGECCRSRDRKKNQFCPQGHDTLITGRLKNGTCIACPKSNKQFCVNEHDTYVIGRDTGGHCRVCAQVVHTKCDKLRRSVDINFRLAKNLRGRLTAVLKENLKTGSAVRDLGCSIDFLIAYLQAQFYNKMTWDNWGTYWEIDHIKELADFDLSKRSQLLKAVNYMNLRPLTKSDHWAKSAQAHRNRQNIASKIKGKL